MRCWIKPFLVFLGVYLTLLIAAVHFGPTLASVALPLFHWEIGLLAPDYRVANLVVSESHGETDLMLTLILVRTLAVNGHLFPAGVSMWSSAPLGQVFQPLIVCGSLLLAWPVSRYRERAVMLGCAMLLLLLEQSIDSPLVLLGGIEQVIVTNYAPDTHSLLVNWMNFLNGGGRLAFAFLITFAAVACGRRLGRGRCTSSKDDFRIQPFIRDAGHK